MIQSVDRAVRILTVLQGGRRMSLGEVASRLGLPASTVHGIIRTLLAHGMVQQERDSGRYRLGPATLRLGNVYLDTLELRARVATWAEDLAERTGLAVRTGVLLLTDVVVVHHVPRPGGSRQMPEVGIVIPAHACALGKALLAYDGDVLGQVLADPSERRSMTGETVTDPAALRAQLTEVRSTGVATEVEEAVLGECGIAAPLVDATDDVTGAMGLVVPSAEWPPDPSVVDALRAAARAVSRELGAPHLAAGRLRAATTRIGLTGSTVELRIGLGLAALARPAYITGGRADALGGHRTVDDLRRRSGELIDAAYRAGVRYLDVARSYGHAEEFLADWLRAHPEVDDVVIGSKWGYRYVGDWRMDAEVHEVKDHSLGAFVEQIGRTREVLGRRLDVYHIHSATLATGVLDDHAVLRALARLRTEGVRVGLSTSGPEQAQTVRRAMEVDVDGEPLFTSVQSTWNLLEPSAGVALQEAAERGARVIVKEAVANGRLAPGGDGGRAAAVASELGIGLDQLAVAAALDQPWAWCVLSGAVTAEQLASNLAAASLDLPSGWSATLPDLAEPAPDYWAARSRRPWT